MRAFEDDPAALRAHAASCWDRAFRGYDLTEPQRMAIVRDGLNAVDGALRHASSDPQSLVYRALLLRLQAALDPDVARRRASASEADAAWRAAVDAQRLALIQRV